MLSILLKRIIALQVHMYRSHLFKRLLYSKNSSPINLTGEAIRIGINFRSIGTQNVQTVTAFSLPVSNQRNAKICKKKKKSCKLTDAIL